MADSELLVEVRQLRVCVETIQSLSALVATFNQENAEF